MYICRVDVVVVVEHELAEGAVPLEAVPNHAVVVPLQYCCYCYCYCYCYYYY